MPPFCKYHFEKDLEMSNLDEAEERRRRLQLLESRWSLSLQQEAPRLLQLFERDAFAHQKGFMFVKERVRLTIRFIKEIEIQLPKIASRYCTCVTSCVRPARDVALCNAIACFTSP